MPDDDLRLNGLERFRKRSSSLTLEAYSSCEVPAGCGGVVLRWRRPGAPLFVSFFLHVDGKVVEAFLDGEPINEQRRMVRQGAHVLALVIDAPGSEGVLLLRMTLSRTLSNVQRPKFVSGVECHCRGTTTAPPDDWRVTGFDDSQFFSLVERDVPEPTAGQRWSWNDLTSDARGLGLPRFPGGQGARRVWIRCPFGLNDEGFA